MASKPMMLCTMHRRNDTAVGFKWQSGDVIIVCFETNSDALPGNSVSVTVSYRQILEEVQRLDDEQITLTFRGQAHTTFEITFDRARLLALLERLGTTQG